MNVFSLFAKIGLDTSEYERGINGVSQKSKPAQEAITEIGLASETLNNKLGVLTARYDEAQAEVDRLTDAFNKSANESGFTSKETQKLADELAKAEKDADSLKKQMEAMAPPTEEAADAIKNAGKEAQDAGGKFSGFAKKIGSGLATAAKIGAAAIGTATTAVGAFAKIGLDYNSQMEQYTTNFTTMLGSQEAAVQKVEELKKFAASTPLSMSDLAQGTQTLLAFGVASEDSTSILRQLGDIALGDADKMQRLSTAFGKATAQGKVTGDTVQQMIDAGFNPLIQISKAAGETMEETQKRMSDGAISVAELEAAMEAVTSGTGQFAGGMEAASHTTEGLISTLKDNAAAKLGEAFQSVSDILKEELLPRALEFVDSLDVEAIVSGVQSAIDAFINFSPVIAAATAAMVAYKAASAISSVIDALTKATEAQSIAQAALNAVMNANPFVLVATLIAAVGTALVTLYATNEDFRNKVQEIWENIKEVFSGAWDAIKIVWDVVPGYFENVWNTIKGIFSVVESILSGDFEGAWEAIKNVLSGWGEYFEGLWKTVKDIFFGVKDWFFDVGKDILTGIWNGITDKVEWLKGKVSGVVDTIKGWFTGKDGFDEHSPSKWGENVTNLVMVGLGNGFKKGESSLLSTADGIIDSVMSRFNETADMDLRLGGIEFDGANRNRFDFETARVGFESSVMGAPIAAAVNAISGMVSSISDRPTTYQLVTPEGKVLAEYMADPLVDHMNANGTPIVNPIS